MYPQCDMLQVIECLPKNHSKPLCDQEKCRRSSGFRL